jgi:hypothetical protein
MNETMKLKHLVPWVSISHAIKKQINPKGSNKMQNAVSYDSSYEKWAPVLNEESAGTITDKHRKAVTAAILENQEQALREEQMIKKLLQTATTSAANWNPVLIALVRRAMPNLVAYDIVVFSQCLVQQA